MSIPAVVPRAVGVLALEHEPGGAETLPQILRVPEQLGRPQKNAGAIADRIDDHPFVEHRVSGDPLSGPVVDKLAVVAEGVFRDVEQGRPYVSSDAALEESVQECEHVARLGVAGRVGRYIAAQAFPVQVDPPADAGPGANTESHHVSDTTLGEPKVVDRILERRSAQRETGKAELRIADRVLALFGDQAPYLRKDDVDDLERRNHRERKLGAIPPQLLGETSQARVVDVARVIPLQAVAQERRL